MDYDYVFEKNTEREVETFVGIEAYSTPDTKGIGGIYKDSYKDFIVKEITESGKVLEINEDRDNPTYLSNKDNYTTFNLVKVNRTTFNAINELKQALKISRRIISYSGLKDKHSISVQKVSIRGDFIAQLSNLNLKDIFIRDIAPTKKRVRIGSNRGNNFTITLRKIPPKKDLEQQVKQLLGKLKEVGFPNYFGLQRFGTYRPNSHLISLNLLEGNYEKAVREFVSTLYSSESDDLSECRAKMGTVLNNGKKLREAYKNFPKGLTYECNLIEHLIRYPGDYKGAMQNLSDDIVNLVINAFQSFIFNKLITERVREGIPLFKPVNGDVISILDDVNGLETNALYTYGHHYDSFLDEALKLNRAAIVAPIIGYDTDLNDFPLMKRLFKIILREENIDPQIYDSEHLKKYNLKGTFRSIQAKPIGLKLLDYGEDEVYDNRKKVKFEFSLNKGTYATMHLRELIKEVNISNN